MSGEATANLKSGGITMCNNNGICNCFSGNNWWWIIILLLLMCNCGGNGGFSGNGCGNNWNGCDNNCGCC